MVRGIDLQGGDRLADLDGVPTGLSYAAFEAAMLASKRGRAMQAGSNRLHLAACRGAHDSRRQGEGAIDSISQPVVGRMTPGVRAKEQLTLSRSLP